MDTAQVLTAGVAIYGALLSSANLFITMRSKRWRVTASYALMKNPNEDAEDTIHFFAANLGERSVTLMSLWIGYRSYFRTTGVFERLSLSFSSQYRTKDEWPLPAELAPGKSITIRFRTHFVLEHLAPKRNAVEELVGVFEDAVGHRFVTGPLTADFQKWTVNGQQIGRLPPDPPGDYGPTKTITATGPSPRSYRRQ